MRITSDHAVLVAAFASSRAAVTTPPDPASLPLPTLSNAVGDFRAAARRELSPQDFARVDDVYTSGIRAGCRWAAECPLEERAHTDQDARTPRAGLLSSQSALPVIDQVALLRFLGALAADSPSRGHTMARLRGAQTGLRMHGIRLHLPPNLAFGVGPGLTTVPITEQIADRIRSMIPSPTHAAALAALLCTGSPAPHLASIPVSALTIDADAIVLSGVVGRRHYRHPTVHPIPISVRPLFKAARAIAQLRGTDANQHLLSGGIGTTGRHLRNSAHQCDVTIPPLHPWSDCWISRVEARPTVHENVIRDKVGVSEASAANPPRR